MDTICIPDPMPATVTRPRPLIEAIMSQSLREQGPDSRTAAAWRWMLTGTGPSPVSHDTAKDTLPTPEEITAEARHGSPPMSWPPWRYAFDHDPDRQQARRVLRWLTGAADAIPLMDPARGRFIGARFHFARTDDEIRRVRGWAMHGLREHGDLPDAMPLWQAEQPWQWPSGWMNAAWLRGTIAYLDWILGDSPVTPLSRQQNLLDPQASLEQPDPRIAVALRRMYGVGSGVQAIENEIMDNLPDVIMQGHPGQDPAEPTEWPPPQWGEAVEQAHAWVTGEDAKPPADHHGCGDYYPCPGLRRCSCEAAGYCLRGQCPACRDRLCNAAWTAIQKSC